MTKTEAKIKRLKAAHDKLERKAVNAMGRAWKAYMRGDKWKYYWWRAVYRDFDDHRKDVLKKWLQAEGFVFDSH